MVGKGKAMSIYTPIMRTIVVTASYVALSEVELIGKVTISCLPTNSGNVTFQGDDGSEVPWVAGEWHDFDHVDLSTILIKGTADDIVTVVGGPC